jgi:hypothetical protein
MPCAFPGWDNTPRRNQKGILIYGNDAGLFKQELQRLKAKFLESESSSDLLFINAWNEWAEGNHLEPCMQTNNNRCFLDAIKKSFN